jgi:protein TonB
VKASNVSKRDIAPDEGGEVGYEAARYGAPLSSFDARWLWGIAVVVPIVLAAGVFYLHQLPAGPHSHAGGPVVEVRLVQEPVPDPMPIVARPDAAPSEGRPEPMIDAPNRPIPEATTTTTPAPTTATPEPSIDRNASAPASKPRPVTSGSASAFRRTLLGHIARFRRYPPAAQSGQHGVALVMFAMRRDGAVSEVWVRTSSGHLLLDEAATETIRRAQPLPTIPPDLPDRLTVLLPVSFDPP